MLGFGALPASVLLQTGAIESSVAAVYDHRIFGSTSEALALQRLIFPDVVIGRITTSHIRRS